MILHADVYEMECEPHGETRTPYGPELLRWQREHKQCPGRMAWRVNTHATSDAEIMRIWEARRENGQHW